MRGFSSHDGFDYLLMTQIKGEMACTDYFLERPMETVKLLAEGIKMLQSVQIDNCPFDNSLDIKLNDARENIENNLVDMSDWEANNRSDTPSELLTYLQNNKPTGSTNMFTHGDYCLPNVLLKDNKISGFIDLGQCGIADMYQDIALCVRSFKHNFSTSDYRYVFWILRTRTWLGKDWLLYPSWRTVLTRLK